MRTATSQTTVREEFFVDEWLVQPLLGTVSCRGQSIHLEPKAMEVLLCLAARPARVISKDELLQEVWPDTYVTEHVLTQAIFQLRRTFSGNEVIETIPRRGYRLTASVRAAVQQKPILAVLPLTNFSGDATQEYFADGMTEALISALAQIGALRVISRTSVMQYKGSNKTLPQIASELHVDHIVEGSVSRDQERVRIAVQLIRATDDQHVWANNYVRELHGVLELQDEVARGIAQEIRITLTPEEHRRLQRPHQVNPVAHELYLKGRYCYFQTTAESLRMSVDLMKQSIAADPEYPLAYAGLAISVAFLSSGVVSAIPTIEAAKMIRPAVSRALELDPDLPEAHLMNGWIKLFCEWDWAGAERAYTHMLELNPSYAQGYGATAWLHLGLNRTQSAIEAWRQACKLDPFSVFFQTLLGYTHALSGQMEHAIEQFRRIVNLEPNYYYPHALLSGTLSFADRHQEAILEAETALRLCNGPAPMAYVGFVYARAGNREKAKAILAAIQEFAKSHYVTGVIPAAILTALGQHDQALDHLETALRMHDSEMVFIRLFPAWRPLYEHPRFVAIVRAMNFPG